MSRWFGALSALSGISAWALLFVALVVGGLDASGPVSPLPFIYAAGACVVLALISGLIGFARRTQRVLAAVGVVSAVLFALAFVGLVPWR